MIELILVMALIALMFFFTLPRIHQFIFSDAVDGPSRQLVQTIENLKKDAVRSGFTHTLHLDVYGNQMWVTSEDMDEEQRQTSRRQSYRFPDNYHLLAVDFPLKKQEERSQEEIVFFPQGYSDKAVVHLATGQKKRFSLYVEPFIANVRISSQGR